MTLLQIIRENPTLFFEFWGSFKLEQSNIGGGENSETKEFIDKLQLFENVILHGPVSSNVLALGIKKIDAFLICYDVQKDQSKGTNYHKVMEYLATGKVTISNNISTYQHSGLIEMILERANNNELPALFKNIVLNIEKYNSHLLMQRRVQYAIENRYSSQIDRIEGFIYEV